MGDLSSKTLIIAKGGMFFAMAVASAALLYLDAPLARTVFLLAVLVWSSSRFYYFLFYVLEKYVDARLRYAGVLALVRALWRNRQRSKVG